MTDAPEKIWLKWEPGKAVTQGPLTEHPDYTAYTRTDVALAMVAAALRENCVNCCGTGEDVRGDKCDCLTPADAQAALEAVKREARNEALREAAEVLRNCKVMPPEDAILALMEDTDDE